MCFKYDTILIAIPMHTNSILCCNKIKTFALLEPILKFQGHDCFDYANHSRVPLTIKVLSANWSSHQVMYKCSIAFQWGNYSNLITI